MKRAHEKSEIIVIGSSSSDDDDDDDDRGNGRGDIGNRGEPPPPHVIAIEKLVLAEFAERPPFSEPAVFLYVSRNMDVLLVKIRALLRSSRRESELFRPPNPTRALLEQVAEMITDASTFRGRTGTVLATATSHWLTDYPSSMQLLRVFDPVGWLDSTCVDAIGAAIERRYARTAHSVVILPSYFWTATDIMPAPERIYADSPPPCRYVASFVNIGNLHWTLLVADVHGGTLHFYDSLGRSVFDVAAVALGERLKKFRELLCLHFPAKRWSSAVETMGLDAGRRWPTQYDSSSCGLYALRTLEYLATNTHGPFRLASWDSMIPILRVHYLDALLNGRIAAVVASLDEVISASDDDDDDDARPDYEDIV